MGGDAEGGGSDGRNASDLGCHQPTGEITLSIFPGEFSLMQVPVESDRVGIDKGVLVCTVIYKIKVLAKTQNSLGSVYSGSA